MTATDTAQRGILQRLAAEQLRSILGRKRRTPQDIARVLGVTPQSARNRINEVTPLSLDDIEKLAVYFDVSPVFFLSEGAGQPSYEDLSRPMREAATEAAKRYSREHDGERVEINRFDEAVIIENGEIVAKIKRQPDSFYSCRNTWELAA